MSVVARITAVLRLHGDHDTRANAEYLAERVAEALTEQWPDLSSEWGKGYRSGVIEGLCRAKHAVEAKVPPVSTWSGWSAVETHTDPGDGRTECQTCGKWVYESIHSCKGVPVTEAAIRRAGWSAVEEEQ